MSLIIYRKAYTPYKEKNKKYVRRNLEKRNVCKKQIYNVDSSKKRRIGKKSFELLFKIGHLNTPIKTKSAENFFYGFEHQLYIGTKAEIFDI